MRNIIDVLKSILVGAIPMALIIVFVLLTCINENFLILLSIISCLIILFAIGDILRM